MIPDRNTRLIQISEMISCVYYLIYNAVIEVNDMHIIFMEV